MLTVFKDLKLGTKLNLILLSTLVSSIAISGLFLSKILENKIDKEVVDKIFLIIGTIAY